MSLLISPPSGPVGSLIGTVHNVAYHRNGVYGESFYRVEFDNSDKGRAGQDVISSRLLAIVTFEGDAPNAKLSEAFVVNPTDGNYTYRGTDSFGPALMTVINACR